MRIHIFGASCSGVTTLGEHLMRTLAIPFFDSDDFYWEKSDPPYTSRRNPAKRNELLASQLAAHTSWILGGSIINWELDLLFDLAVFLWVPPHLRLERLQAREVTMYGESIFTDPERNKQFITFYTWAAGYDDSTAKGRTLMAHESWMSHLTCPVLEIRGNSSVQERIKLVKDRIEAIKQTQQA